MKGDTVEIAIPKIFSKNETDRLTLAQMLNWLKEEINTSDDALLKRFVSIESNNTNVDKINVLIVGSIGAGKSSTINALLSCRRDSDDLSSRVNEHANVGVSAIPETRDIQKYDFGRFAFWDTPGLDGDRENDKIKTSRIKELLNTYENGYRLIDLVLVIIDGSTRDMGTTYHIIEEVILPGIQKERILVAINQADLAIKNRRHWDTRKNKPDEQQQRFLLKRKESVKTRLKENVGITCDPVYYAAGYLDQGDFVRPYNISNLLLMLIHAAASNWHRV